MNSRRTRLRSVATVVVALALVGAAAVTVSVVGPANAADDYPTWEEVEAAKANESAAAAEAARIEGLLDGLQADAAALGDEAVRRSAAAVESQRAADQADASLASLQAEAAAAQDRAAAATKQAGALAASLARGGDPALGLWLSGGDASMLLSKTGYLTKLSESLAALRQRAEDERSGAAALIEQAADAATARDQLAAAATASAAEAESARQAADARVAEAQSRASTLYDQLASLKGTSAQLEQEFREGQALAQSYTPPSTGGPADDLATTPSGSGSLSPADSRAYAAGQVRARGWSEAENQCLVWLWNRESGWRWDAYNTSSGAYGIPQSLPGSKMAASGADWRTSSSTQINWGLGYIAGRYGTPCGAWAHSEDVGWY
ncbi:hypothetical protein ACFSBZ_04795 [Amnibacterium flavum]|uniref:Lytic transglycosylase domain-containing protein n=1 Tax=Amnibacterium flavum TaxID=2173173 RepID=A0A2V1HTA1_9MICO|nr:hypothetical protein [Amnibacterium flavum]PVZ94200.1 hypothetical protein DDQ50_10680 [Amnibacterium flavum]